MMVMKQIIDEHITNKKITAIYTDSERTELFHVGVILCSMNDWILQYNIGTHGEYDGYSAEPIDGIYRIETESLYLEKIKRLSKLHDQDKLLVEYRNIHPLEFILKKAKAEKKIVSVQVMEEGNDLSGFIDNYNDELVYMSQYDSFGNFDGETVFMKKDIIKICTDDADNRDVEYLARNEQ